MSCYITITDISGNPPYEITICDNNGSNCFLAYYELSYVPPTIYVDIPDGWTSLPFVQVSVKSSDGCEIAHFIDNTPTPTPTVTSTPNSSVTPTVTPSQGSPTPTLTNTKTPTLTPTITTTPSFTPSQTLTNTPTTTVTPTVTTSSQTPTPTTTVTPTISSAAPPLFEVQNIDGVNPLGVSNLILAPSVGQSASYLVNFGDGTIYTRSLPNPPYTGNAYTLETNTYAAGTFISKFSNFTYNSGLNSDSLLGIEIERASDVVSNIHTFSAFTNLSEVSIYYSTINSFEHNLPAKFNKFFYDSNSATTFTFSIPNTATYQHFSGSASILQFNNNTTLTALTINISGITQNNKPSQVRVQNNNALKNLYFYVTTKGRDFFIFNNSVLNNIDTIPSLSSATTADDFRFSGNRLSAWTQNFPSTATNIDFNGQNGGVSLGADSFKTFDVNLNNLTSLTSLKLDGNSLTSLTPTISGCTSLETLNIYSNRLTSLPATFPNSLKTFNFYNNMITGYTSNFPTSLITFRGDSAAPGYLNNFEPWTVDISGATSLTTFDLGKTMLTGWTKKFPTSIRTILFDYNYFTNFDFNLVSGVTTIKLEGNLLSGLTNLSLNNTIQEIYLDGNYFYQSIDIFSSDTPSTMTRFNCPSNNLLTGWTTSFSASTSLNYINFGGSNLNQSSVDFILSDIHNNNSVNGGTLNLYGIATNKPAQPTGGYSNPDLIALTGSPRNWTVTIKPTP